MKGVAVCAAVALCTLALGVEGAFRVQTNIGINDDGTYLAPGDIASRWRQESDPLHVVSFDEPSDTSAGSMPIGNGDLAANVWARRGTDSLVVSVLVSKSDAWSGNTRLLKVAMAEVSVTGVPMDGNGSTYSESLDVRAGVLTITTGAVTIRTWAGVESNVIRVSIQAPDNAKSSVQLYPWRHGGDITVSDNSAVRGVCGEKVHEDADVVEPQAPNGGIRIYHTNSWSYYGETLKRQGLSDFTSGVDPLLGRTFGCDFTSESMKPTNATRMESTAGSAGNIDVMIMCETSMSADAWRAKMLSAYKDAHQVAAAKSLELSTKFWTSVFSDTYIDLEGSASATRNATRTAVSRGYILQRFMDLASGGKSKTPLKFNGMLFSVNATSAADYDDRMWGGGYWFQNTRQMYWAALASGDFAVMEAWFKHYESILPLAEHRNKKYFGHAGAFFPETMFLWGVYEDSDYGCDRTNRANWFIENTFIRHHINGGLELISMMLDYFKFTQDTAFAKGTMSRLATSILAHYQQHYPLDIFKRIRLVSAALETYQNAINPTPDVAGLIYTVSTFRSSVPSDLISEDLDEVLAYIEEHMPALPLSEDGKRIAPAEGHDRETQNSENVELYAVWPFKLVSLTAGVNNTLLQLGRATLDARPFPCNDGWCQDVVDAALLALPDEAARQVVGRFDRAPATGMRFPGFYGPMQDSTPAADHGATGRIAMQWMLMQTDDEKIILFPAWPSEWGDVTFKLRAPMNTVVEAKCASGSLVELTVTPASRKDDVVMPFGPCGRNK